MKHLKAAVRAVVDRLARDSFLRATRNGEYITGGPFTGMRYVKYSLSSAWPPKLLGTYEKELHPVLERLSDYSPDCILDIGAAEGYYAVGLSVKFPQAQVIAFEAEEQGQRLIAELAELNGRAAKVRIEGFCDKHLLKRSLQEFPRAIIVMDIEGGELDLLDPSAVPELKECPILVELHDCFIPGLDQKILSRFEESHKVERIWAQDRTTADLTFHVTFFDWYVLRWIGECRPKGMSWLYMQPRCTEQDPLPH